MPRSSPAMCCRRTDGDFKVRSADCGDNDTGQRQDKDSGGQAESVKHRLLARELIGFVKGARDDLQKVSYLIFHLA